MSLQDPHLRYGLRVALTPWAVFSAGLVFEWKLSFVAAVFTAMFILGQKPVPVRYGLTLVLAAYVYMILAWFIAMSLLQYPATLLLVIFAAVVLSYRLLVTGRDILLVIMALLGALLIPLQAKTSPALAWELAVWLPNNLFIAFVISALAFRLLPPDPGAAATPTEEDAGYDPARRLLRMSITVLPFVAFAFLSDAVAAFTLTFLAVQVTQFAASPSNGPAMIRAAILGNVAGGLLAVLVYELLVIAPFLPLAILAVLSVYLYLTGRLLDGQSIAVTAMTAFTVVAGVSFGPILDEAGGKIAVRLVQIAAAMGYIFLATLVVDRLLPENPRAVIRETGTA